MRARASTPGLVREPKLLAAGIVAGWAAATLIFALLPDGSPGRVATATGIYFAASAFAVVCVGYALLSTTGEGRRFWALLGGGLACKLLGDMSWTGFQVFGVTATGLAPQDVLYAASLILFFAALLRLVSGMTNRTTLIAATDAVSIMISVGLLAWYFVLGPDASQAGLQNLRETAVALSGPVGNAGLLFLALVVLSTRRKPPFAGSLAAAFTVFLLADLLYLRLRTTGPYEMGNWPEPIWALGIIALGFAALKANEAVEFTTQPPISAWRVGSFWFGPLSPAMHFGFLLAWGAFNPPLPPYVLAGGALLMVYFAFRISFISYVSQELRREHEELARRNEQHRISEDLHDTLKQSIHNATLLISAYRNARKRDPETAESILERAIEASREADHLVAMPINELHALSGMWDVDGDTLIRQVTREVEEHFGMEVHENLLASPNELSPEQLAAAYRIVSEALWNAARHSGAQNVWLETRRVGSVFIIKVRDDGRGFSMQTPPWGLGISLMHSRAERAGGSLDIVSRLGTGTTVQARFEVR